MDNDTNYTKLVIKTSYNRMQNHKQTSKSAVFEMEPSESTSVERSD